MESSKSPVVLLGDEAGLNAYLLTDIPSLHVLFLYADFHAPSRPGGQMDTVVNTLASIHPTVKFGKMDAEAVPEVSEQFEINAVPTFLFFKASPCELQMHLKLIEARIE